MTNFIPIDAIFPNPEQPRKFFDAAELRELANSIQIHGVLQPIIVERAGESYILIDGERRLRATKLAGLREIPASIVEPLDGNPQARLEKALVANVQRADLDPIEEAKAYARLRDEFGLSANQIAIRTGCNYASVTNRLILLELDEPIQALVAKGKLHRDARLARSLMEISDKEVRLKLAEGLAKGHAGLTQAIQAAVKVQAEVGRSLKVKHLGRPPKGGYRAGKDEVPAVEFARRRAGTKKTPPPAWDMFVLTGKAPEWALVVDAGRRTCDACGLRDVASEDACRQCPAVEMINRMLRMTDGH